MKMREENNPYDICTWDPNADCVNCHNEKLLNCRMNYRELIHFVLLTFNLFIPAVIGMVLGGYAIYLIGYAAFWVFFFGFFETRILCSHCPFYAERGFTLHCLANYGLPKFWKYHPEPMNLFEKVSLAIGIAILFGYPLPFLILGAQFVLLALTCYAGVLWLFVMQKGVCSKCVNFSCPLNRVPKKIVDNYLQRNPTMRQAWEAKGYKLD